MSDSIHKVNKHRSDWKNHQQDESNRKARTEKFRAIADGRAEWEDNLDADELGFEQFLRRMDRNGQVD